MVILGGMNITILANKDIASCLALNYLLPRLEEHTASLFLSGRVGVPQKQKTQDGDGTPLALAELRFLEQTLFTDLLFPAIDGRGDGPTADDSRLFTFAGLGRKFGLRTVEELNRVNDAEGLARLAGTEPELILSIRYGAILKEAAIGLPRLGVLNLHSGRLPEYRGVMASFWALLQGEAALGTTLHYITDPGIDTGPIIATTTLPVQPGRSYLCHVLALYEDGCRAMAEAVATLAAGEPLPSRPQPPGGRYYSFPEEADLTRFAAAGWRLTEPEAVAALARRFLPPIA